VFISNNQAEVFGKTIFGAEITAVNGRVDTYDATLFICAIKGYFWFNLIDDFFELPKLTTGIDKYYSSPMYDVSVWFEFSGDMKVASRESCFHDCRGKCDVM
jgi:hypothetical protein